MKETELLTDKASEGTKIETVIKPTANLIKDQLPEKVKEDKIMRDLHEKEFKEDEKEEDYMFGLSNLFIYSFLFIFYILFKLIFISFFIIL